MLNMSGSWPPVTSSTLTDQVYTVLRDRILSREVDAGEFIREQDVSDKLSVSRTPVREALGRLATEGFLERIPHRGFRVPEDSVADLVEFYPILCALEVLAGKESLPHLDAAALMELRDANARYSQAFESADMPAGIECNNHFHHLLSAGSSNRRLRRMLDEMRSLVNRLETWAFSNIAEWEDSIREHSEILDAIEEGDFDSALEILEINRSTTYREVLDAPWANIPNRDGTAHVMVAPSKERN